MAMSLAVNPPPTWGDGLLPLSHGITYVVLMPVASAEDRSEMFTSATVNITKQASNPYGARKQHDVPQGLCL